MALLLHVPVLHNGYLELFRRRRNERWLYLINEELINEFPLLAREVRRVEPEKIAEAIRAWQVFDEVVVVGSKELKKLSVDSIISADEAEMHALVKKYLPGKKVEFDTTFLRYNPQSVAVVELVDPDLIISTNQFDQEVMAKAAVEATHSSDWFRHVGAVIVKDKKVILSGFNQRRPTPHAAYTDGDPRNFIASGTDTHQRLAMHAEQDVITQAARQGIGLEGANIYVTTFPCPDCAILIIATGFKKCYFQDGYSSLGGQDLLRDGGVKLIKVQK